MKDKYDRNIKLGDILEQTVDDDICKAGSKWEVIGIGIEYSTKKRICSIKQVDYEYIASCYQCELKYFKKVEVYS